MERAQDFYKMTFSQRERKVPLPDQMQAEHIPSKFRRLIWKYIDKEIRENTIEGGFGSSLIYVNKYGDSYDIEEVAHIGCIVSDYKFEVLGTPHDEIVIDPESDSIFLRNITLNGAYHELLTLIEYFLRHEFLRNEECMGDLRRSLVRAFDEAPIAYSLIQLNDKPVVIPKVISEGSQAIQQSIDKIREAGMHKASTYLCNAAEHINAQQYPDSIANSIHAVESAARLIDPRASKTLGAALNSLAKKGLLTNTQLKAGFEKLYAYTNSEEGVRHALVFQNDSKVGLDEAMFMYGACASFAAYLVSKHRQQAEKQETDD